MPQNPPAQNPQHSTQSYTTQSQRNGNLFVGIGILGGLNATTFYNTDFEPTDVGLYLRIGKQYSIVRTYISYSYIDHFGDSDDDWVEKDNKYYKAKSFGISFGADLMPKLPSSPLYGILGFDIGWERLRFEYQGFTPGAVNGLNLGIKGGFAVEFTPNFQLELTGRISASMLGKAELQNTWKDNPSQMNITGMIGLNFVF